MKQLVIETCVVNYGDDRGGVVQSAGDIVDIPKDLARNLSIAGRTLYVSRNDDHDKSGRFTATRDMLAAAQEMAAAAQAVQTSATKDAE